ncbi:lipase [Klebsiella michiganensis]|uniref:Lipase n=1 Tax=Klebsiella michiganensis TaxID=1134687 RepID=A0A7H4PFR0_9ENTR|nr:lipase [Klebsiella michiganensis]
MPGNRNISLSIQKSNTAERYTWDSDHQPRYEDILAERINASDDPSGLAFNQAVSPVDSARGMSVGWNFSLTEGMTSGPVASLHSDLTSPPLTRNAAGTGYVNTLGWRGRLSEAMGRTSVGSGEL